MYYVIKIWGFLNFLSTANIIWVSDQRELLHELSAYSYKLELLIHKKIFIRLILKHCRHCAPRCFLRKAGLRLLIWRQVRAVWSYSLDSFGRLCTVAFLSQVYSDHFISCKTIPPQRLGKKWTLDDEKQ